MSRRGLVIIFLSVFGLQLHASRQYYSQSYLSRCSQLLSRNGFAFGLEESYSADDKAIYSAQLKELAISLKLNPQSESIQKQFVEKLTRIYFPFIFRHTPTRNEHDTIELFQMFLVRAFMAVSQEKYNAEMGTHDASSFYYFLKIAKREISTFVLNSTRLGRMVSLDALNEDPDNPKVEIMDGARGLASQSEINQQSRAQSEEEAARDLTELIGQLLASLPKREREIFSLRVYEGLSFKDIASDPRVLSSASLVRQTFCSSQRRIRLRLKRTLSSDLFHYWYKKGIF